MAMMCCVGDVMAAEGKVVNSTYISHSTITCGTDYNTELAKTNVSSAYGGASYADDLAYFANMYCGGSSNLSGSPVCYKVYHKSMQTYKLIVFADCGNSTGAKEYIELTNSGFTVTLGKTNTQSTSGVGWRATFGAKCGVVSCSSGTRTQWGTANSVGIQTGTIFTGTRDCNLCQEQQTGTDYRCAANWYGNPSNATSGCTRCVDANATNIIATSPAGSTTQSKCTYKCAAGYYGNATYIPSSCVSCPTGSTSPAGATAVSSCSCKSKYYGDASAGKACKSCPPYATCNGGNGSTFECPSGYFGNWDTSKSYVGCFACPQYATCDSDGYTCNAGYYASAEPGTNHTYSCTGCPGEVFYNPSTSSDINVYPGMDYGPLAKAVAYDKTDCYIPANHYYPYKDTSGQFRWASDCHYSE